MASEDPELQNAHRQWLATRPKTVPRRRKRVLERAEQRLLGSIKRREPQQELVSNAERVRHAQLACLRAQDLIAALPTDVDDYQTQRHRESLAQAKAAWEGMPVEDIIAFYSRRL